MVHLMRDAFFSIKYIMKILVSQERFQNHDVRILKFVLAFLLLGWITINLYEYGKNRKGEDDMNVLKSTMR